MHEATTEDCEAIGIYLFLFQIIIEKAPTSVPPGGAHFNMKGSPTTGKGVWDVKRLLEVRHHATPAAFKPTDGLM